MKFNYNEFIKRIYELNGSQYYRLSKRDEEIISKTFDLLKPLMGKDIELTSKDEIALVLEAKEILIEFKIQNAISHFNLTNKKDIAVVMDSIKEAQDQMLIGLVIQEKKVEKAKEIIENETNETNKDIQLTNDIIEMKSEIATTEIKITNDEQQVQKEEKDQLVKEINKEVDMNIKNFGQEDLSELKRIKNNIQKSLEEENNNKESKKVANDNYQKQQEDEEKANILKATGILAGVNLGILTIGTLAGTAQYATISGGSFALSSTALTQGLIAGGVTTGVLIGIEVIVLVTLSKLLDCGQKSWSR